LWIGKEKAPGIAPRGLLDDWQKLVFHHSDRYSGFLASNSSRGDKSVRLRHQFSAASLLFVAFIAGCATPAELREKGPAYVLTSKLSAKQVAACIASKWESASPLFGTQPVNMKIQKDGYSVALGNEGTMFLVDIKELPNGGSSTAFFKYRDPPLKIFEPHVANCQKE
jgi:hypothetical protein